MSEYDVAVLLIRVVVGGTMVAHGYNHLWGNGGLAGTARWFESLGMRPAKLHALLSGAGELVAGAALVLGALTPLVAAFVVATMVVAAVTAHRRNGFFVFKDGYEYVLMIAVVCIALALLGPGGLSIDHATGLDTILDGGLGAVIAAGGGTLGAVVILGATWRPARTA
ncbi:DoxX family protein [Rhodococcus sp. NPDC057529]|uniref:DoxX family protein n=1 Tax=Rhodococcus sp. NPDC057529 TaxID=3346158 RepID=UPI00366DD5F2